MDTAQNHLLVLNLRLLDFNCRLKKLKKLTVRSKKLLLQSYARSLASNSKHLSLSKILLFCKLGVLVLFFYKYTHIILKTFLG
jgi:hypothetical protein